MARRLARWLWRIAITLAIGIGALVIGFVILVTIGIRVDLSFLRPQVEDAARRALGREVTFEGALTLVPTWSPTLEVGRFQVSSPSDWPTRDFAHFGLTRLRVGLLPLLQRDVVIRELRAESVKLRFERRKDGAVNWDLAGDRSGGGVPHREGAERPGRSGGAIRSLSVKEIALRGIEITYRDAVEGRSFELAIDELDGNIATHDPLELSASGSFGHVPWQASLQGDAPADLLLEDDEPWPLRVSFEIAETAFELSTRIDVPLSEATRENAASGVPLLPAGSSLGEIAFSVEGERLDSLEPLLGVTLPPWGPHRLSGKLRVIAGQRAEAALEAQVKGSRLEGRAELDVSGARPRVLLELEAPEIQLADFDLGDWRPLPPSSDSPNRGESEAGHRAEAHEARRAALLSEAGLRSLDGRLSVRVGRVLTRRDELGAGEVEARLENGRLVLDPIRVEGQGGAAQLSFAFHPSGSEQTSELRVDVDRFDYGVLARRLQPEAQLEGFFALDLEARSRGPLGAPPLAHADGHLDVAVFPTDLAAGAIDLWTVNLLMALLPIVDPLEDSRIQCAVGFFDLEGGVMRERELLLDTTNMSVSGRATIDFRARTIDALLRPKAKKPRFLSLATPVRVKGSFEDFGVGVTARSLLETTVRVVTSPVHVPLRRILGRLTPATNVDDCLEALRQAKRSGRE